MRRKSFLSYTLGTQQENDSFQMSAQFKHLCMTHYEPIQDNQTNRPHSIIRVDGLPQRDILCTSLMSTTQHKFGGDETL